MNMPKVISTRQPSVVLRRPIRSATPPSNSDPNAMPIRPMEARIPSSPGFTPHSVATPGSAKLMERASNPSRPFRPMVMMTARICSQHIGDLASVSRGSVFTTHSPYIRAPAPNFSAVRARREPRRVTARSAPIKNIQFSLAGRSEGSTPGRRVLPPDGQARETPGTRATEEGVRIGAKLGGPAGPHQVPWPGCCRGLRFGVPTMSAAGGPEAARMPRGIPFIVVNEFAERFCFYGINAMLALFLVQYLQFGEAQATTWASLFKSGAYFFPLLGAIVSDVFWGKFRTVLAFSVVYAIGCIALALSRGQHALAVGLFLVAFGTGGIKPCVATNVGDQFTNANQHLIERAFSWFYLAINAGSTISILLCPWLLPKYGPTVAFGAPAAMMVVATVVFWFGRKRYAVVPPAGRIWLKDVFGPVGLKTVANLFVIYVFIAVFWSLWDQSNGTSWSLQARSSLMDKNIGFGITLLPAQVQAVNAVFILIFAPFFSYVVYPLWSKLFAVTPLRKIAVGLFVTASSFIVIAWIESRIQNGHVVSLWWQILAYAILTCGEVLVSITGLEFSY